MDGLGELVEGHDKVTSQSGTPIVLVGTWVAFGSGILRCMAVLPISQ